MVKVHWGLKNLWTTDKSPRIHQKSAIKTHTSLNLISLWEWMLCHRIIYVRQDWNTRTVVSSQENMCATTHQNSYSISHLLGTVTTQWLSLWRCSHCSLVPHTVTTEQWLHRTHVIRYPLPWGLCRNLSTRHLVGNCIVTTWEDTRYLLHTVTVQESRWHRNTVL